MLKSFDYQVICERVDSPFGQEDRQIFNMAKLNPQGAHGVIVKKARNLYPEHMVVSYSGT